MIRGGRGVSASMVYEAKCNGSQPTTGQKAERHGDKALIFVFFSRVFIPGDEHMRRVRLLDSVPHGASFSDFLFTFVVRSLFARVIRLQRLLQSHLSRARAAAGSINTQWARPSHGHLADRITPRPHLGGVTIPTARIDGVHPRAAPLPRRRGVRELAAAPRPRGAGVALARHPHARRAGHPVAAGRAPHGRHAHAARVPPRRRRLPARPPRAGARPPLRARLLLRPRAAHLVSRAPPARARRGLAMEPRLPRPPRHVPDRVCRRPG